MTTTTKTKVKQVPVVAVSETVTIAILNEIESATFVQMETVGLAHKMRKTGNRFLERGVNVKKRALYIIGNTYQDSVSNRIAKVTGENVDNIVDTMVNNAKENGIDVDDETAKTVREALLNKAQADAPDFKADKRKYAEHISPVVVYDEDKDMHYVCNWPLQTIERCFVDDKGKEYNKDEEQEIWTFIPDQTGSKKQAQHGLTGKNQVRFTNFKITSINRINVNGQRWQIKH